LSISQDFSAIQVWTFLVTIGDVAKPVLVFSEQEADVILTQWGVVS
jgi:hypothetical protein